MKHKFKPLLCLIAAMLMLVLASCGAEVSTTMTVDSNFNGSRVITAKISADDLDSVTGGAEALTAVAADNLPQGMTFENVSDESGLTMTFTVDFSGIDDYRSKIETIIKAGDTDKDTIIPSVIFESADSYFKKGLSFRENFDSIGLMRWYINAVDAAGIVSESKSNWYERAGDTLVLDGTEYTSNGYGFSTDTQVRRCLSGIDVNTEIKTDGTFKRTIQFNVTQSRLDDLKKVGCELEKYLSELCPSEEDSFRKLSDEESYYGITYEMILNADSAEQLVEKTDKVLQTQNRLDIEVTAVDGEDGMAELVVTEELDGSFYLDYSNGSPLTSNLTVYDNVTPSEDINFKYSNNSGSYSYSPMAGAAYSFRFDWMISFKEIELDVKANSIDKLNVKLTFVPMEGLDDALIESANKRIEAAAAKGGTVKSGDKLTVTFKGTKAEVEKAVNRFIGYADENYDYNASRKNDDLFFTVKMAKFSTPSLLTDGVKVDMTADFRPVLGDTYLAVRSNGGQYFIGDEHELDKVYESSSGDITAYSVNASITGIVLTALSAIVLLFGIVLAVAARKGFADFGKYFAQRKQNKAVAQPQYVAPAQPAETAQPAFAAQPAQPAETAQPAFTAQPAQPAETAQSAFAAQPAQPAETAQPVINDEEEDDML